MSFKPRVYRNSTELANLNGIPIYMDNMVDAALRGRLNTFLQGDTGSGKTQLVRDVMGYFGSSSGNGEFAQKVKEQFGKKLDYKSQLAIDAVEKFPQDKSLFLLGRNDMDTRELFRRINLGRLYSQPQHTLEPLVDPDSGEVDWYYSQLKNGKFLYQKLSKGQAKRVRKKLESLTGTTEDIRELTDKINVNFIAVDELPNCVPAVRAQLFNLFDGFIEIDGKPYPIGSGYCVGMATGNIGQQFTESSNELGRALRDRMHLIIDTDYFRPKPHNTFDMLERDRNPRVSFSESLEDRTESIVGAHEGLQSLEVPFEKYIIACYLVHGLDYLEGGKSKIELKSSWPNKLEGHEVGSDAALILPVSPRAAKSIITLSQALDQVTKEKGATDLDCFNSMMTAFKFASAYSGILNEATVRQEYDENHYSAMDAVIATTQTQFDSQKENIAAGVDMAKQGKKNKKLLDEFSGRWGFMRDLLENLAENETSR